MIGGSLVMALGAGAIALSSAGRREHRRWLDAAARERDRYDVDPAYTRSNVAGRETAAAIPRRTAVDWTVLAVSTATFVAFAMMARSPQLTLEWDWAAGLALAMLALLAGCGVLLWRTTRFS